LVLLVRVPVSFAMNLEGNTMEALVFVDCRVG
jgi:hypothetical protein